VTELQGVLFDVDGTLVDTNYLHTVCWWQAFTQAGMSIPMAVIHRSVGMGSDRLIPHLLAERSSDAELASALTASHDALYSTYWSALTVLPGARQLLRHCHDSELTTVLASSAGERELAVLRAALDCEPWIDAATSAADGDSSKPAPDLVLAALDKGGLKPQQAVFVGDAVWDVEAAGQAGLTCIGLESGGTSAAELRAAGAWKTFKDPADLLASWSEIGAEL
jgi:HAD superfamily hydrolase (TIGR01509 family)